MQKNAVCEDKTQLAHFQGDPLYETTERQF